ncbi:MAG: hypothetical protein ACRC5C_11230 [Bacilli bacterium]
MRQHLSIGGSLSAGIFVLAFLVSMSVTTWMVALFRAIVCATVVAVAYISFIKAARAVFAEEVKQFEADEVLEDEKTAQVASETQNTKHTEGETEAVDVEAVVHYVKNALN